MGVHFRKQPTHFFT